MKFWNTTVVVPVGVAATLYVVIWIVILGTLFMVWRNSRKEDGNRWTTQDIISVAIIGVLCMVANSILGDNFIGPIVQAIPGIGNLLDFMGVKGLPYEFVLITGIAVIRKPGAATALIFLKYFLEQLIYGGSGVNPIEWPKYLYQGIFIDMYIMYRGKKFLANPKMIFVDAIFVGFLKDFPRTQLDDFVMGPLIKGEMTTIGKDILQLISDGGFHLLYTLMFVHAAVRVSKSITQLGGRAKITPPPTGDAPKS